MFKVCASCVLCKKEAAYRITYVFPAFVLLICSFLYCLAPPYQVKMQIYQENQQQQHEKQTQPIHEINI